MRVAAAVVLAIAACSHAEPPPPVTQPPVTQAPPVSQAPPVTPLAPAPPPLIPRSALLATADHALPRLSPDGNQLAWIGPLEGVPNIWVAKSGDLTASRALTHDIRRGIGDYHWAYDNKHILYTQDTAGDQSTHVFIVDVASGVSRDATPFPGVTASIIAISPAHRNSVLIGSNRRDPQWPDVVELDLDKATTRPLYENQAQLVDFKASDDFTTLVGMRLNGDSAAELVLVDAARKKRETPRAIASVPFADQLTTSVLGFSGDGRTLYLRDSRGRDTAALVAMDIATAKIRLLADDERSDVRQVIHSPATHVPQVAFFEYDTVTTVLMDPSVAADTTALRTVEKGTFTWEATLDDRHWTVTFDRDDGPPRYYLYDRDTREAHYLFSARAELENQQMAHRRPIVITARDGVHLVSYLTLPAGLDDVDRPEQPVPLVLYVHGGPWQRDSSGYDPVVQWLANRGYAVLQVSSRGSIGFGKRFASLGTRGWGGVMQDDLVDGVKWAQATFITAPGKVAIAGVRYGGYATLIGVSRDPLMFECGIDVAGPTSLATYLAAVPPAHRAIFYARVADPRTSEGQALLHERSPLTNAALIERPLLVAQGANDTRAKRGESEQLVAVVREHQIPVAYALFPDEGHELVRQANRLAFFAVAERFLAQYLNGRFEPRASDSAGTSMQLTGDAQ